MSALAESASSHPISKSLQKAYGMEIDRSRVTNIQELSGNGVIATGGWIIRSRPATTSSWIVWGFRLFPATVWGPSFTWQLTGKYAGHIVISDIVKPHSQEAIQALKSAGVRKTVMLTGDAKKVADSVASALELDRGVQRTASC